MFTAESPELDAQVYSIAPAEGQIPIPIMTDTQFEELCNPDEFCFGSGGFYQYSVEAKQILDDVNCYIWRLKKQKKKTKKKTKKKKQDHLEIRQ